MGTPPPDARRDPRLLLRCRAVLSYGARRWEVVTEDLSPGGCQFASPIVLQRGQAVWLEIQLPDAATPFATAATVAWISSRGPLRLGVEFTRAGRSVRERRLGAIARHPRVAPPAPSGPSARGRRAPEGTSGPSRGGASKLDPLPPRRERSSRAQTFLDLAHLENAAGRAGPALEWLRAAHAVAPEDVEITEELELAESPAGPGGAPSSRDPASAGTR